MLSRRNLVALPALLAASGARAQRAWPDRPIRLLIPFPPGNTADLVARAMADGVSARLGQPVVVENRAGAGGAIGMAAAAQAAPDGYTLVMGHVATHVVNMAVHRNPGYDTARDFVALGITSTAANILVVNPQRQPNIRAARDFVDAAKAKPGELSYGSAGVGSPAHITTALFLRTAGVEAHDAQADVLVARRAVQAAAAARDRALADLDRAAIRAPFDGTVLTIQARPGERVGNAGLLTFGGLDDLIAEVEVYETQLRRLARGQPVMLRAAALPQPLTGRIERIGAEILRQSLTDASPAANTDARVARVQVALEPASAAIAARFVGLQVVARFGAVP
ncbi:HlyD family efflux transporter periplasmic adaptor subunit [Leptolyngbya sp. 15MV]|nr:HlyD family efflux transporter periplasmic adaptor subunit [Leptolyngbya sp. 15MV]